MRLPTLWQWTNSSYQGTDQPVTDPTLYGLVYGTDGKLFFRADCNTGSSIYTYDGGMVGSVRVQPGAVTMAACSPDSRSDELVGSLIAAQDYRVLPGGDPLQLNMPASGPVLTFRNAGAPPDP